MMSVNDFEKFLMDIKDPEELGEHIHILKKKGYQFMFYGDRLIVGQEFPILRANGESPYAKIMSEVSDVFGIHDRKSYEEADDLYNLTMY